MKTAKPQRPILQYHGGKWRLASWIISHFPEHRTYVEPFGGAASVLLQKRRTYAEVYNDLDADIVNLFQAVRDQGQQLKKMLTNTPFSRLEYEKAYQHTSNDLEAARRTVIRAFMGFGSAAATKTNYGSSLEGIRAKQNYNGNSGKPCTGFRASSSRSGTTPAMDWKNYPDKLETVISRLRGVVIECRDAQEVMEQHDSENTLHYCDPPYVKDARYLGQSTQEYRHELSNEDHEEFCDFVKGVQGGVIISGYDNEIYDELLSDWRKEHKNALADGAKKRQEVLWISPDIKKKQKELF